MWTMLLSLAGQAASGIMSALNNRRTEQAEESESARQRAYFEGRANENPMERSDNAAILGTLDRKLRSQNETAAAKNKVLGGTPEMDVATKKATANAYADAVSSIAANASKNRDTAMDNLEKSRETDAENRIKRMDARNQTYANLAANAANAFVGLGGNSSANAEGTVVPEDTHVSQLGVNTLGLDARAAGGGAQNAVEQIKKMRR